MKYFFLVLLASFFFCSLVTDSLAEEKVLQGSKEEARAMVENAAVWFKKYGREKMLMPWVSRDMSTNRYQKTRLPEQSEWSWMNESDIVRL